MDKTSKRILIAPLDWGLGHVTRCVPLIRFIRDAGHVVIFAGNASQCDYISRIFNDLLCLPLQGYEVRYARSRWTFMGRLLLQLPRLGRRIRAEHKWLQQQVQQQRIDAVISDNRYGLYSPDLPCVLITHQLLVLSGRGSRIDRWLQQIHYRFIAPFGECWVPDTAVEGVSGILGHPEAEPPVPLSYLGLLSQCNGPATVNKPGEDPYLLVLLSGTEPQRSILAGRLWQQVQAYKGKVVFVEGSAAVVAPAQVPGHIDWYARVAGEQLTRLIAGAAIVVCRSGYSSLMDLLALHKKAILVPTPGQTEQEYLAADLHRKGIFYASSQVAFDLEQVLTASAAFPFYNRYAAADFEQYRSVLNRWLGHI